MKATFGARAVEDQPGFFVADAMPFDAIVAGLCHVQDPSTAAAPELLAPRSGENVLDACAAPGGKAGILATLMENNGCLLCIDSQQERVDMTAENLHRLGVTLPPHHLSRLAGYRRPSSGDCRQNIRPHTC
ncbi:MAG: hypothetical protein R3F19_28355 [Verrucomicrobiales bacterium]